MTPADSSWYVECTTAQLAAELLRRSSTAVITIIPLNSPNAVDHIFVTDDVPNARALSHGTTSKLNEIVRVLKG